MCNKVKSCILCCLNVHLWFHVLQLYCMVDSYNDMNVVWLLVQFCIWSNVKRKLSKRIHRKTASMFLSSNHSHNKKICLLPISYFLIFFNGGQNVFINCWGGKYVYRFRLIKTNICLISATPTFLTAHFKS